MSDTDGTYLRATGYVWYEWQENIPFNPSATYKISCRYRQVTDPSAGTKYFYCGYAGVTADGTTYANATGANSSSSQHYHGASGTTLAAGSLFTENIGYTKGYGSPNGTSGPCPAIGSPCLMYNTVRYIRPLFILDLSNTDGIEDLDYIKVEKQ